MFTAADLRALPAAWGYELWLTGPAGDRPVTMLPPGGHGMAGPVVASGLRPGDHLVLTAEPAGASPPLYPDDARRHSWARLSIPAAAFVAEMMEQGGCP